MSDHHVPAAPAPALRADRRAPSRTSLIVAIALALTTVGALALPAATLGWSAGNYSSASEQELLALTNQARSSAGRKSLRWDSSLASIARWRSRDMIKRGYFSHDIPGGGRVFDEMTARGYCYKLAGENIGWNNYPDENATAQIQQMFMNSADHRSNILARDWDRIGIGAYKGSGGKKMWTVLFADSCTSSTGVQPKPKPQPKPQVTAKPKPRPTPPPVAAAEPSPVDRTTLFGRDDAGEIAPAPEPGSSSGPAAGQSLRVVDGPTGGLLDSIFGDVARLFFGN
ncbi:MAG: hypothetical protein QOF11_309 [Chloroflexota bacterium]|nr:hypothetical protein [Chloroflexota bacterium]